MERYNDSLPISQVESRIKIHFANIYKKSNLRKIATVEYDISKYSRNEMQLEVVRILGIKAEDLLIGVYTRKSTLHHIQLN